MNGIERIVIERINQLDKHGHSVSNDLTFKYGELLQVALSLITGYPLYWPSTWNFNLFERWIKETRQERLAKAAAFLAAEIDRLDLSQDAGLSPTINFVENFDSFITKPDVTILLDKFDDGHHETHT